ncbi:hypothetical protein Salmuc_00296 [Salipiger mucosus DSM 16094]|uniref:Uncharacterized protein n=2 Tax=Salipiger mucosus TaxID=263378 RepID=S9QQQ3_9RHOB|nr:hypothetical protein Salmuc_00296 [Salipiger mucosus DSM 16094]
MAIIALAVFIASLLAGTLVLPGPGTAGGPMFVISSLGATPALGLILAVGAIAAIALSRNSRRE